MNKIVMDLLPSQIFEIEKFKRQLEKYTITDKDKLLQDTIDFCNLFYRTKYFRFDRKKNKSNIRLDHDLLREIRINRISNMCFYDLKEELLTIAGEFFETQNQMKKEISPYF